MSLVSFLEKLLYNTHNSKKLSAKTAKERLQIIVAHERGRSSTNPDFLPLLKQELIDVISKYVQIDQSQVKVELESTGACSVLELNVVLPGSTVEA